MCPCDHHSGTGTGTHAGHGLLVGVRQLHNFGKKEVVVDSVRLAEPHGLRFADAVLVPATTSFIGYDNHCPPSKFALASVGTGWQHRRPAVGATIAPQPATPKTTHNLVVAIRVTGTSRARMKGITVDYHVGGRKYRWHNVMGLSVETEKKACR
ncbi:hypothetical protein ACRAWF_20170 [Streptomyces sp. L7]